MIAIAIQLTMQRWKRVSNHFDLVPRAPDRTHNDQGLSASSEPCFPTQLANIVLRPWPGSDGAALTWRPGQPTQSAWRLCFMMPICTHHLLDPSGRCHTAEAAARRSQTSNIPSGLQATSRRTTFEYSY